MEWRINRRSERLPRRGIVCDQSFCSSGLLWRVREVEMVKWWRRVRSVTEREEEAWIGTETEGKVVGMRMAAGSAPGYWSDRDEEEVVVVVVVQTYVDGCAEDDDVNAEEVEDVEVYEGLEQCEGEAVGCGDEERYVDDAGVGSDIARELLSGCILNDSDKDEDEAEYAPPSPGEDESKSQAAEYLTQFRQRGRVSSHCDT